MSSNAHFKNVDRAAYELPVLLNSLHLAEPADQIPMMEAAGLHAENASSAVLNGLEAIGHILVAACTNTDWTLDPNHVMRLGALIGHLAVEAQHLQDAESDMKHRIGMLTGRPA